MDKVAVLEHLVSNLEEELVLADNLEVELILADNLEEELILAKIDSP
jgi:hypothetical protein